jgi:hypothetical protein
MFTASEYFDVVCFKPVDKPVSLIYPAAPPAAQVVFERFGFSYSGVFVAFNVLE